MDPYETENPFEEETDRIQSEEDSSYRVNLSAPSSPPAQSSRIPSSPPLGSASRPTFPSLGSHRKPQEYKNDYCCARDQWLHSGEDAEITVSWCLVVC